jgi:RNA polymerase sigma factor (sigma-70 family)
MTVTTPQPHGAVPAIYRERTVRSRCIQVSMKGPAPRALERDSTVDDDTLIARSVAGDLAAYSELVARYQLHALRVATAIIGPAGAEDATQEAFVRAFKALARFDRSKPFRPWLMTIVANASRNQRRAARRWERSITTGGRVHVAAAGEVAGPEALVVRRSEDVALLAALARLPGAQRRVVACRYLMDLTEEETATVLGIPRGTVKSRLARGLARLEKLLSRESHHGG